MIGVNDDYSVEVTCTYKGETYHVRDNGAVFRVQKGERKRKYDGFWTFGIKHIENGYMYISQERVHRIVATAFHGEPKSKDLVVDHIDTNRANNRPENLRWVTKLENALNNPITRAKIIYICGSVENFLKDPTVLYMTPVSDKNFGWMRTVSKEEAKISKERLEEWAKETPEELHVKVERTGEPIDEWIFSPIGKRHGIFEDNEKPFDFSKLPKVQVKDNDLKETAITKQIQKIKSSNTEISEVKKVEDYYQSPSQAQTPDLDDIQPEHKITDSLTPNAKQEYWFTPTEFPFCPKDMSIEEYYNNIKIGGIFSKNTRKIGVVVDKEWIKEGEVFVVLAKDENAFNPWMPSPVYIKDGFFIHRNGGAYYLESIARKVIKEMKGEKVEYDDIEDAFM